jgi:uncharacterized lipoprotein YddW (UPF0748 family)
LTDFSTGVKLAVPMRFSSAIALALCSLTLLLPPPVRAQTNEYRAYWVDAFGAGFRSAAEVTALINDLRAGHFNAVFVEVRKRGDAYYTPNTSYPDYEPKATDMAAGFDSLADLLAKAHDTTGGKQRIEVHAWLVTYPIWNSTNRPASAQHPFNRHPEWLNQTDTGATYADKNYYFDPGHPGVQRHTYTIALDLLTRYDVDGINFDYVRYMGREWGYNTNSVARFNTRFGRSGVPVQTDAAWQQFRRDQVTALVRKVWLNARATKPGVKISADTITWAPGPTSVAGWLSASGAYTDVLQDWRGWMEEGILDLNVPMAYFDQSGSYTRDWTNWNNFAKDYQYGRHALIGPGAYLNWASNSITQLRYARTPSPAGNMARGVCAYSYRVPFKGAFTDISRSSFHTALVTNGVSALDPHAPGVFELPATIPPMPWKTSPTTGHLMGYLYGGSTNNLLDGARITVTGPVARAQTNDATGFYGFVDLPLGNYTLNANMTNQGSARGTVTVSNGLVAVVNLILSNTMTNDGVPPVISGVSVSNLGPYSATVLWTTDEPADSVVEFGVAALTSAATNSALVTRHSVRLSGLAAHTPWQFRVRSADVSTNQSVSALSTFTTLPPAPVDDVIVDDAVALTVGAWTVTSAYPGYWGSGYRYATPGAGAKYVEFRPELPQAGAYNLYAWYLASAVGGNRTTNAQHIIAFAGGTQTVGVNQEANSAQWRLLGTFPFAAGTDGYVRVTDVMPEPSGNVVVADGLRWQFIPPVPVAPILTQQPQPVAVFAGQTVSFTADATGTLPLSFQWQFGGTDLAAATGSTFAVTNVQLSHAGQYSVVVTNAGGVVSSTNAWLSVSRPQPGAFTAVQMLPDGRLRLEISGSPGATYQLEGSTNLTHWLPLATLELPAGSAEFLDPGALTNPQRFYRTRP